MSPSQRCECGQDVGCSLRLPVYVSDAKTVLMMKISSDNSIGDKSNPLGVDKIYKVKDQVDICEDCHHHLTIPWACSTWAVLRTEDCAILLIEAEDWPNECSTEVKDHSEEGVNDHKPVKGEA